MKLRSWRWWHWCIAALAVLALAMVTTAVGLRSWSTGRLAAVEARLRAEGRPLRYADIAATQPVRDPARQAAWEALEKRWNAVAIAKPVPDAWMTAGAPLPAPAEVTEWLADHDALLSDTLALIRDSPPVIGTIPLDGPMDPTTGIPNKMPDFLALMSFANGAALAAMAHDDGALVDDLDRLLSCIAVNSLMDGMIVQRVVDARDQAHLLALLRGPADDRIRRWMASPPVLLAAGRAGMRGERLNHQDLFVDQWLPQFTVSSNILWAMGPADAALLTTELAGCESQLAGIPVADGAIPSWAFFSRISLPNQRESRQHFVVCDAQERAARMAAVLLMAWRDGQAPPDDRSGLPAACIPWLTAGPAAATLRYRRQGEGFVIDIDPAAPMPPAMGHAVPAMNVKGPLKLGLGVSVGGPPTP